MPSRGDLQQNLPKKTQFYLGSLLLPHCLADHTPSFTGTPVPIHFPELPSPAPTCVSKILPRSMSHVSSYSKVQMRLRISDLFLKHPYANSNPFTPASWRAVLKRILMLY